MKTTTIAMALIGACALGTAGAAAATPGNAAAGAKLVEQSCFACHGMHGRSVAPTFPRLAGQTPAYIAAELQKFKNHIEGDPEEQAYMWGMAAPLTAQNRRDLAAYFAQQRPVAGQAGDPDLMAQGKAIFERGIPALGVPACAACHGAQAQGVGAFPRLAGQHVDYLVKELKEFKSKERFNPIMFKIDHHMTLPQMHAVAVYLRSLS